MHGVAGVGSEVTGSTMASTEVSIGLAAHESASGSGLGRSGGHTGDPMAIPMPTRQSSPCHPPKSMCNPQHRPLPSLLHRPLGIPVTIHGGIIPTCSNVQGDGAQ
jgi:hypothetical protein